MIDIDYWHIIIFLVGIILGFRYGIAHIKSKIFDFIKEIEKDPGKFESLIKQQRVAIAEIPILVTESVEDVILLYDKNKKKFLCQGSTLDDLANNLWAYNKIAIAIVKHNDNMFWFIDGKIQME